jgi:N-methylhydantoinase A
VLAHAFRTEYERLVGAGTAFASAGIEVVTIAVEVRAPVTPGGGSIAGSSHAASGHAEPTARRDAWFDGASVGCPVYDGSTLPAGFRIPGPAFIELPTTTLVVYPGQTALQEPTGDIRLLLASSPVL